MGFRQGAYARIWSVKDEGNYSTVNLSISKKNKETEEYETEFQDGYVRLVGDAHKIAQENDWENNVPEKGISIQISSCDVTNKYDAAKKKLYINYAIFGLELLDSNNTLKSNKKSSTKNSTKKSSKTSTKKTSSKAKTKPEVEIDDEEEDDLPF